MSSKYCVLTLLAAAVLVVLPASLTQAETIYGQWQFNEKADGLQADGTANEFIDDSGNNHHGTWVGTPLPYYRTAPANYNEPSALDFGGSTSDYVTVPHSNDLNLNLSQLGTHTIDVIFKTAASEAIYAVLYAKGTNQGLMLRGGKMEIYLVPRTGTSVYLTALSTTAVNDNEWHHGQVVFDIVSDPDLCKLNYYLDGDENGSYFLKDIAYQANTNFWPENADIINESPLQIGYGISTGTNYNFRGQISMLKIAYNPIPEPSTFALLTCGLFGLLAYAWRKRK